MMRAHKGGMPGALPDERRHHSGRLRDKHMSCIPKEGDRLIIAGRVLVVEKMDHNRVSSILLLPPEKKEDEPAMESGVES